MIFERPGEPRSGQVRRPELELMEPRQLLSGGVVARAAAVAPTYALADVIKVPGLPLTQFDISVVDSADHRLYFADRANGGIDIIDTSTNTFLSRVPGFAGPAKDAKAEHGGPQGITLVGHDEVWATDGDSTVKVIQLNANRTAGTIIDSISTGGQDRGDEITYDPKDHIVVSINNDDTPPYLTIISTNPTDRKVLDKITFPDATDGLEQPLYDPATGMILVAVPDLNNNPGTNAIAKVNPKTFAVSYFPLDRLYPSGLALGPNHQLLVNDNGDGLKAGDPNRTLILDDRDGHLIKGIPGIGGSDEIWYNPGNKQYYEADRDQPGGGVLGIIDAKTLAFAQAIPTSTGSKSVSADSTTNEIYVPLPPNSTNPLLVNSGIGVYAVVKPKSK